MARKNIGINLDDNDMNSLNDNFIELYNQTNRLSSIGKTAENVLIEAQRVNRMSIDTNSRLDKVIGGITEDTEVIDARRNDPVLGARLDRLDKKLYPIDFITGTTQNNEEAREAFVRQMNKKAEQLGMVDTNFVNPHGLHDINQYTTAKDLLLMGIHSLGYKELQSVMGVREKQISIEGVNSRNINVKTSVEVSSINDNYDMLGAKTGTLSSQVQTRNLLSIVGEKYDSKWYIASVLDTGESRYTATRFALNAASSSINSKVKFDGHKVHKTNGNFYEGLNGWSENAGNPSLDYKEFFTFPASLKAFSAAGTPSQIMSWVNLSEGDTYYMSAMVRCDRYSSGDLGLMLQSRDRTFSKLISVKEVTPGWVKVSGRFDVNFPDGRLFAGGINSADLDGFVDNVNFINLSLIYGRGKEPSKSQLDALNLHEIDEKQTKVAVSQVPANLVSYNPDNLPILFEQNAREMAYPASITKVMTAMVLLDNYSDLTQKFTIATSDVTGGSGSAYNGGDVISIQDALYSLMLESSNTIANALARIAGRNIILNRR